MRRHYHSLALSQPGEKYGNRRESLDRSVTAAGKSQQGGSWGINATTPVSPTLLSLEGISHRQNQRGNQKARKPIIADHKDLLQGTEQGGKG